MNSDYLNKIIAKKQQLKQLHNEKGGLQKTQADIQKQMEERSKSGKAPDQNLVNQSKELPQKLTAKESQITQGRTELSNLNQQYAKSVGEDLKKAGAEKPQGAKEALQTPIGLRKGQPVHQYKTPYPDSKTPQMNERLKPSDNIKDWNEKKPQQQNNAPELDASRQKALEQAKGVGEQMKQNQQQKDQDLER